MADEDDDFLNTDDVVAGVSAEGTEGGDADDPLLFEVEGDVQAGSFNLDDVLKAVEEIDIGNKPAKKIPATAPVRTVKKQAPQRKRRLRKAVPSAKAEVIAAPPPRPSMPTTTPVSLDIQGGLEDFSQVSGLIVQISNLPTGASLNKGKKTGEGVWALSFADTAGLSVFPPKDGHVPFELTVTARQGDDVLLEGAVEIVPEAGAEALVPQMGAAWDWSASLEGNGAEALYDESLDPTVELTSGSIASFGKAVKPVKW